MTASARPILSYRQLYVVPFHNTDYVFRFLADDGEDYHFAEVGKFTNDTFVHYAPPEGKKDRRVVWSLQKVLRAKKDGFLEFADKVATRFPEGIRVPKVGPKQSPKLDEARAVLEVIFPHPEVQPHTPGAEITDEDRRHAQLKYDQEIYPGQVRELVVNDRAYKEAIARAKKAFPDVPRKTIRSWVAKHMFYEGHENACIAANWLKGAKGVARRGQKGPDGKRILSGRKTNEEKDDKRSRIKRQPMSTRELKRWHRFLRTTGAKSSVTMQKLIDDYRLLPSVKNGRGHFCVLPKNLGSDAYLADLGREVLAAAREEYRQKRRWNAFERLTSGGNANVLTDGEVSVFDLDATKPKNFIVLNGIGGSRPLKGNAQPLVFLAVDRRTSAIVGWYVCFGHENGRAYLSLLYSAFTDKEDEINRWGVTYRKDEWVHGFPQAIFVDRGAGISKRVQELVCELLRLRSLFAEPGRGEAKGHVEGRNGLMQRDMAHLPGSGMPSSNNAETITRQNAIRKGTGLTLDEYMKELLKWIRKRNTSINKKIWMSPDMVAAGIPQTPVAVFNFIANIPRGDRSITWSNEELYKKLCEEHPKTTTDGYIKMSGGRIFYSKELEDIARNHYQITGEAYPVRVLELPSQSLKLNWLREGDDRLMPLKPSDKTAESFENTYRWAHEAVCALTNRDNKIANLKRQAREVKDANKAAAAKGVVSKDTQKKMVDADETASMSGATGAKRQALRKMANEELADADAQHHADTFAKGRGESVPERTTGTKPQQEPDKVPVYSVIDDYQDLGD